MRQYFAITDVKPLEDYQLILTFENGEQRIYDMKPHLNTGIFRELKDKHAFNNVKVNFDTIEWCNKADFDPEILYEQGKVIDKIENYL
jgi:hypothetical protein